MDRFEPTHEQQIMASARHDPAAFAPLYEVYYPRMYAYCLRRLSNASEAEDLTSIIFTKVLRSLHGYRGGNVGAWLFRIAHNELVNYWRNQRQEVSLDEHEFDFAADDTSPVERLVQQENAEAIRRAVALLPSDQQELLALKLAGQLTSEQIGEVLGKSASAVRVEVHRIMKHLRVLFEQEVES